MSCERCKTDPQPANFGSPRTCAFDDSGKFTPENWNCETLNYLLNLAIDRKRCIQTRYDDNSIECVPALSANYEDGEGGFLVFTRYKNRGCTSSLIHVGDFWPPKRVTLVAVNAAIDALERE